MLVLVQGRSKVRVLEEGEKLNWCLVNVTFVPIDNVDKTVHQVIYETKNGDLEGLCLAQGSILESYLSHMRKKDSWQWAISQRTKKWSNFITSCFSGSQGSGKIRNYQWLKIPYIYYFTLLEVRSLTRVSLGNVMVLLFLLESPGEDLFSCIFQLCCCIPWLVAPSSLQSQQWLVEFYWHHITLTPAPCLSLSSGWSRIIPLGLSQLISHLNSVCNTNLPLPYDATSS